jgi:transcriptional regulator with XRE-family HTH domain
VGHGLEAYGLRFNLAIFSQLATHFLCRIGPNHLRIAFSGWGAFMKHILNGRPLVKPGAALKNLRAERGWSLADLSRRTGMPVSSLSKIENDKMDLTLDKLLRISVALETDIAGLFTPPSPPYSQGESTGRRSISRADEGNVIDTHIGRYRYLAYDLLNKHSIPIIIDVTAKSLEEFGEFNRHPGEEMLYVIDGELDLYTNMYLPVNLRKGDCMYFDSNMGHAYIAAGEGPCRILSVCIAPESELLKLMESKTKPGEELPQRSPADPRFVTTRSS